MPELPEVTVIVRQLNRKLKGLILESIEYDWPKKFFWNGYSIEDLRGAKVEKVERIGKIIIIKLVRNSGPVSSFPPASARSSQKSVVDQKDHVELRAVGSPSTVATRISILIHLKLTGQLIYQDEKTRIAGGHPIPPLNLPVPNKTTRVIFAFTNPLANSGRAAGHLYFNDMRKFGWVKIVESEEAKVKEAIGMVLGPDALEIGFDDFKKRLNAKGQWRIKKLLMDQKFVSGIGNIYSDEALWRAKIHPRRSAISLSAAEIRKLYEGIRESLKLAIEKGGSSRNAFVDSGGEKGLYLSYAKAYHMTGKPCARCKTPIVRQKMDSRSAHFCPKCQKL